LSTGILKFLVAARDLIGCSVDSLLARSFGALLLNRSKAKEICLMPGGSGAQSGVATLEDMSKQTNPTFGTYNCGLSRTGTEAAWRL
jgi:hypothetical protein